MVWSSARPRNVVDMVDKCFGTYKEGLKAIWVRDTLGLSSEDYRKKMQTTKDLAKPWARIPSLTSNLSHTQFPENPNSEVDADRDSLPSVPQQQHSALTTILLDDSPLDAVLQPWNHLCISDYGTEIRELDVQIAERTRLDELERRKLDVRIANRELEHKLLAEWEPAKDREEKEERITTADPKMKGKELLILERLLLAKRQQLKVLRRVEKEENLDELLLAVIGILDTLKHEGNLAGWMRSGRLVHVGGDQLEETISETSETETPVITLTTMIPMPIPMTLTSTKRDSSTTFIESPSKRRRLTPVDSVF